MIFNKFYISNCVKINYFVDHHGKSPVDAQFGIITQVLNTITSMKDINNTNQLRHLLQTEFNKFNRKSYLYNSTLRIKKNK